MDEPVLRAIVVGAVVAVGLLWGVISRRGIAFRRRRVTMEGMGAGVFLFTSETCAPCDRARRIVAEVTNDATEIRYENQPSLFAEHGVDRVPAIAHLDERGVGWIAEGVPQSRRLRRWLTNPRVLGSAGPGR